MTMKVTCLYCDKEYETKRETSCYCSNSCRTGAYKLRKKNAQKEAKRQIAIKAQKEKDNQQKLIETELQIQNAVKRKKAREEKALKTLQENEKIANESSLLEEDIHESELPPKDLPKQPEKPETKDESLKYNSASSIRRKFNHKRSSKSNFWESVNKIVKACNDYNNKK